jgi:hypothetical protein
VAHSYLVATGFLRNCCWWRVSSPRVASSKSSFVVPSLLQSTSKLQDGRKLGARSKRIWLIMKSQWLVAQDRVDEARAILGKYHGEGERYTTGSTETN